jgi:hypothetical protein
MIQQLCDTLVENPSWNEAHVVVRLVMIDILSHPSILKYVCYDVYELTALFNSTYFVFYFQVLKCT